MKKIDVIGGLDRLIDASAEKFNSLCEESGYDPEDPILTGADEEGEEIENGGGDTAEGSAEQTDGNAMPEVTAGETAPEQQGADVGGGVPPEVAAQMQQVPQDALPADVQAPVEGGQPAAPQLTPEEEEQLKAAQAQQQQ